MLNQPNMLKKVRRLKVAYIMRTHLRATERHLPYGIAHLPARPIYSTQVNAALTPPDRPVLDLSSLTGWKAELTVVLGYTLRWSRGKFYTFTDDVKS